MVFLCVQGPEGESDKCEFRPLAKNKHCESSSLIRATSACLLRRASKEWIRSLESGWGTHWQFCMLDGNTSVIHTFPGDSRWIVTLGYLIVLKESKKLQDIKETKDADSDGDSDNDGFGHVLCNMVFHWFSGRGGVSLVLIQCCVFDVVGFRGVQTDMLFEVLGSTRSIGSRVKFVSDQRLVRSSGRPWKNTHCVSVMQPGAIAFVLLDDLCGWFGFLFVFSCVIFIRIVLGFVHFVFCFWKSFTFCLNLLHV